jgi:transposase-like protein
MEKTRMRRDANTWREIVDRQVQSGSTAAEFCEREGLSLASFYGWRSKLRHDAGSGSVSAAEKPRPAETHSSRFIDLGALGMSGPRIEVRLELGGGVALQLVRG